MLATLGCCGFLLLLLFFSIFISFSLEPWWKVSYKEVLVSVKEHSPWWRSTMFLSSQGVWLPVNWISYWSKSLVFFPIKGFGSCFRGFLLNSMRFMSRQTQQSCCKYIEEEMAEGRKTRVPFLLWKITRKEKQVH